MKVILTQNEIDELVKLTFDQKKEMLRGLREAVKCINVAEDDLSVCFESGIAINLKHLM